MPQKLKQILVLAGVIIVVIIVISVGTKSFNQYEIDHEASSFVHNILTDKGQASYNQFTAQAKKNTDPQVWNELVEQWSDFFKGQTPIRTAIVKNKDYVVVDYTIKGSDGTYLFEVTLVGSGWGERVQAFNSSLT